MGSPSATLQRTRDVKEKLRNYSPSLLNEMVAESLTATQQLDALRASSRPHGGHQEDDGLAWANSTSEMRARAAAQRKAREDAYKQRAEEFRQTTQRRAVESTRRKDAEFQSMYKEVLEGLSNDSGIMGETDYALSHSMKIKQKKTNALKEEWDAEVFDKIQGRLQRSVEARSPLSVERRLKEQYDQYLHTTNTKVAVFRDVIIEADYNPMTANDASIRIPTGDIRDPLKRDVLKPMYERALMGQSLPSTPLGKETLDNKSWGTLAIGATPYGHCVDSTGAYIIRPQSRSVAEARRSRIPMDHYDYAVGNAAAAAEVKAVHGKGKSIPPGPEMCRGRDNLYDVVQHTCHLKPSSYTGGDLWLEAKGKAAADGPEVRRGRLSGAKELVSAPDTLQDKRPGPGQTYGDFWLDAKGKSIVPGPEQRRGRPNLTETFQQLSNPYQDGRALGDSWLEYKGRKVTPPKDSDLRTVMTDIVPPPAPRPPVDARKYDTHLVVDMHQVTSRV